LAQAADVIEIETSSGAQAICSTDT